jgi:hypothetical protein
MRQADCNRLVFSSTEPCTATPARHRSRRMLRSRGSIPYGDQNKQVLADRRAAYRFGSVTLRYYHACGADDSGLISDLRDPETHLVLRALVARQSHVPSFAIFARGLILRAQLSGTASTEAISRQLMFRLPHSNCSSRETWAKSRTKRATLAEHDSFHISLASEGAFWADPRRLVLLLCRLTPAPTSCCRANAAPNTAERSTPHEDRDALLATTAPRRLNPYSSHDSEKAFMDSNPRIVSQSTPRRGGEQTCWAESTVDYPLHRASADASTRRCGRSRSRRPHAHAHHRLSSRFRVWPSHAGCFQSQRRAALPFRDKRLLASRDEDSEWPRRRTIVREVQLPF